MNVIVSQGIFFLFGATHFSRIIHSTLYSYYAHFYLRRKHAMQRLLDRKERRDAAAKVRHLYIRQRRFETELNND